jgi:mxaD protein
MKMMAEYTVRSLLSVLLLSGFNAYACGPSPQKVVEKVVIHDTPEHVWAVVGDFAKMGEWHPGVVASGIQSTVDADGNKTHFRTLTLSDGGQLIERIRPTKQGVMKLGVVIEKGDMAVSNYSDALTVKAGSGPNESIVTWTGRFNNKANLMVAPEGQDDAAAIAAVKAFYTTGLNQLAKVFEKHH